VFELAAENRTFAAWSTVLRTAASSVNDQAVIASLGRPGANLAGIADAIADIGAAEAAKVSPLAEPERRQLGNFLRLLAENRRLGILPEISAAYEVLKTAVENRVDVVLSAASPVDESQRAKIIEALRRKLNREVNLQFRLDPSLIGGARLQVGDLVIDGSVRTGLEKLTSALVR
jgi:F-type H+-transporting ATPase subunit delta